MLNADDYTGVPASEQTSQGSDDMLRDALAIRRTYQAGRRLTAASVRSDLSKLGIGVPAIGEIRMHEVDK